ncbi:hypothetical protein [Hornefia butyriciproducens]|uniref:hypothetical protein n=1 Tax=Hornefia butyriciproducens TaxID=2652293 RepID=UPI002A9163A2|nr:hypothetical protein [Hornefia butyriciproducens]MDY5463210.1 hypothetical protein [Hornefia butyriciproducens]
MEKIIITMAGQDVTKQDVKLTADILNILAEKPVEYSWNPERNHGHVLIEIPSETHVSLANGENAEKYIEKEPFVESL